MDEKSAKKLEWSWKTLTLIGAIAASGFAAATYFANFQTVEDAKTQHESLRSSTTARITEMEEDMEEDIDGLDSRVGEIRVRNVRIEITQQQVLDELRHQRVRSEHARTRTERDEQEARLEELQGAIDRRERVLRDSYGDEPPEVLLEALSE